MKFKILSLDGGGIRGVLSATLLKELETQLRKIKNQSLHEYFDLVTGTSTGSILAAGIVCQMTADEMVKIYINDGNKIFIESIRNQRKTRFVSKTFGGTVSQVLGGHVLYPHEHGEEGLAKILQKRLIHKALGKSLKMREINKPNILIPAYDVYSRNTTWFVNNNPENSEETWYDNIELWKICTASASAPTFFPPYELPYNAEQNLPHIDGGVSANNPSLAAIAHALFIKKKEGLNLKDIAVFSIGTGNTTYPHTYDEIKGWGDIEWAKNIPDLFMSPSAKNSEDICGQMLESVGGCNLRLNFDLNERFQAEKQPNRLRENLSKRDKPYNQYIAKNKNEHKKVSEDMDNPDNCLDLIEAAECYLDCGETYYNNGWIPVREAIQDFIVSNG